MVCGWSEGGGCVLENLGAGLDVSVRVTNQRRECDPSQSADGAGLRFFRKGNVAGDYIGKSEDALGGSLLIIEAVPR